MGSYARLHYFDKHDREHLATSFAYKFYGYIEDKDCAKMESYNYLNEICDLPVMIVNVSYIGTVCELSKREALKFMQLYSNDFCIFSECVPFINLHGWSNDLKYLRNNTKLYLSFD